MSKMLARFLPLALLALQLSCSSGTPLDDYVNKPDDTYTYEDLGDPYRGDGFTSYYINLTSQRWLTRECFDELLLTVRIG